MMRKVILIIVLIILCIGCFFLINNLKKDNSSKKSNSFENQNGENVTITADKVVSATGFAGASNYQFYLKDDVLYFENISIQNSKEILATGVKDLYLDGNQVTAKLSSEGKIVKENDYIIYN